MSYTQGSSQSLQNSSTRDLSSRLKQLERDRCDFWTFGGRDGRTGAHSLFHYPAMMVPQVQGTILDLILAASPDARHVLDPFVGSGTILVESMHRGLRFTGIDINPLAGLLCLTKTDPPCTVRLVDGCRALLERIASDCLGVTRPPFANERKWFEPAASVHLSRIVRSIEAEDDLATRRVFWVALARCIRLVCNSRQSTYKLHQRPATEIAARDHNSVTSVFADALDDIVGRLDAHRKTLQDNGYLIGGQYTERILIQVDDTCSALKASQETQFDIVVTSPPYGDNITTVPYGQYSYLPMMWIPLRDICDRDGCTLLRNTHSTDTASLGGSLIAALDRGEQVCGGYPAFRSGMDLLKGNLSGLKRFSAFAADLAEAVQLLAARTVSGGFHAWTIGDRFMAGIKVPMGDLLAQMLQGSGIEPLHTASRRILAKKMAHRNALSATMTSERIIMGSKA